jgi:hypothetical protein
MQSSPFHFQGDNSLRLNLFNHLNKGTLDSNSIHGWIYVCDFSVFVCLSLTDPFTNSIVNGRGQTATYTTNNITWKNYAKHVTVIKI